MRRSTRSRSAWSRLAWRDAVVGLTLGAVAFTVRRYVPADGPFYDDAWQAFGARKATLSDLVTVGQTQPGFTAGLMVWTRLFGTGMASLVAPAQIAGTLGPPVVFAGLRWFGLSRSASFLVGAAVVAAPVHIAYSHHVKTYTFDVLIVLGLALAVWRLAHRRWTRKTAVAWFLASVAVGWFSSIALFAAVLAGGVLVLYGSRDRRIRIVVVGAQSAVLGVVVLVSSRTYDERLLHGFFADRGGYVDFDPNPVTFAREVVAHLRNIAEVFPGAVPTLSVAAAAIGLAVAARRGPLAAPARFIALMAVAAAGASVVGVIPFGPPRQSYRVTLWLVPVVALGLGVALDLVRRKVSHRAALRTAFDAVACAAAVLTLVTAFRTDHSYPAGGQAAIRQVMEDAGPDDAVATEVYSSHGFGLYSGVPAGIHATPDRVLGFRPAFLDPRVHLHDTETTPEDVDRFVDGRDRVYVVYARLTSPAQARNIEDLSWELTLRGFRRESTQLVETGTIEVWDRDDTAGRLMTDRGGSE